MIIQLLHRVKFHGVVHRFRVMVDCPFRPEPSFMFVFRNSTSAGDDCALIVDWVDGWDATNGHLLVRTREWDIDDWKDDAAVSFNEAKQQLIDVVGCEYVQPDEDS